MIIYVSHSTDFNYKDELYESLRELKLEFIFPHEAKEINSKEQIKKSDMIIAEVSFNKLGIGIEIGWANAFNKPIIFIYKKGIKISNSLKFIPGKFIEYSDKEDMINKIKSNLR